MLYSIIILTSILEYSCLEKYPKVCVTMNEIEKNFWEETCPVLQLFWPGKRSTEHNISFTVTCTLRNMSINVISRIDFCKIWPAILKVTGNFYAAGWLTARMSWLKICPKLSWHTAEFGGMDKFTDFSACSVEETCREKEREHHHVMEYILLWRSQQESPSYF